MEAGRHDAQGGSNRTNTVSNALHAPPGQSVRVSRFCHAQERLSSSLLLARNPAPHEQRGNHALQQQQLKQKQQPHVHLQNHRGVWLGWRGSFPSYSPAQCSPSMQTWKTSNPLCWRRKGKAPTQLHPLRLAVTAWRRCSHHRHFKRVKLSCSLAWLVAAAALPRSLLSH